MSEPWRTVMLGRLPRAKFNEPLARFTTFRIGGPADCYVELNNRNEIAELIRTVDEFELPLLMLGWGSNLLVRDGGVRGVVARLRGEFERIEFLGGGRVRAGAGVRVPQLVAACGQRGLGGDESLVGVPGTVGGALVMNAGTREGEIGPLVREVRIFDRKTLAERVVPPAELQFDYRRSNLEGRIVLDCLLQLKAGDKVDIMNRVQEFQQKRLQTQPVHTYNVGSTFKNPPGRFVAKLIEEIGLKGAVCGGARVSPMHANFIENVSGARASDVLGLVDQIRTKVKAAFGIDLELEMKIVGEP